MNQPKETKHCLCNQTAGLIMVYCPVCLLNFPTITNLKNSKQKEPKIEEITKLLME